MADISAELQAIMDATYGEEVRGSIHDAIEKINEVNEEAAVAITHEYESFQTASRKWKRHVLKRSTEASDQYVRIGTRAKTSSGSSTSPQYTTEVSWDRAEQYLVVQFIIKEFVDSTGEQYSDEYTAQTHAENAVQAAKSFFENMNILEAKAVGSYDSFEILTTTGPYVVGSGIQFREGGKYISGTGYYPSCELIYYVLFGHPVSVSLSTPISIDPTQDTFALVWDELTDELTGMPIVPGTGEGSIVENDIELNVASATFSHAEGNQTRATALAAHSEGSFTMAEGRNSHAEGMETRAEGVNSHAEGLGTIARRRGQHVGGKYNIPESGSSNIHGTYAEIIGNGTGEDARSNARTLDWEGNQWIAGDLLLGPNKEPLTVDKIKAIEDFGELMQSLRTAVTVEGPTVTITDGAANMPLHEMIIDLLYSQDPETGEITPVTELTITANGSSYPVSFEDIEGGVYKGTFYPLTGILSIEMIENSMTWGEMQFSIDPDNYLGKRIPLPNCLFGEDGNSANTICNVSDTYIYDQSAATHYYVYKDEEEEGYAVVVLPDDTPDETVIQVAGTLIEPVEYQLTPIDIRTIAGNNTFSVDEGSIRSLTYYKDKIHDDIEALQELIEEGEGLFDLIYPVGAVFISAVNTPPTMGTWSESEEITIGSSTRYAFTRTA